MGTQQEECKHISLEKKIRAKDFSDLEECTAGHFAYEVDGVKTRCLNCPDCGQFVSAEIWSEWLEDEMGTKRKLKKSIRSEAVLFLPEPIEKRIIGAIGSLLDRDVIVCSRPEIHAEVLHTIHKVNFSDMAKKKDD